MTKKKPMLHNVRTVFNTDGSVSIAGDTHLFPQKTGLTSIESIRRYNTCLLQSYYMPTTEELLVLVDETSHLGTAYIDYILNNLTDYMFVLSASPPMEVHLKHSKALTKLISVNIWRQYVGLSYNLPPVLSRKFLNIKEDLTYYIKHNKIIIQPTV